MYYKCFFIRRYGIGNRDSNVRHPEKIEVSCLCIIYYLQKRCFALKNFLWSLQYIIPNITLLICNLIMSKISYELL